LLPVVPDFQFSLLIDSFGSLAVQKSTPVVLRVIPVLFLFRFSCSLLTSIVGTLVVDRSVGMPPLTSIDCCCGDSLLPVVRVAGSTRLRFGSLGSIYSVLLTLVRCILESRGLP
jgi:hypothetical protein